MRKVSCMLYSDLHLRISDPLGAPTADGLNTRVVSKLNSLSKVIRYAIDRNCDQIIDLGDTFDTINPPSRLRNAFMRKVADATDNGIQWIRIPGNHETDGIEADGLDLGMVDRDTYFISPTICEHPKLEGITFIPEIKVDKIVEELNKNKHDLIIGHFEVTGSIYQSGSMGISGVPQSLFVDRSFPTFLGHIHKRQILCDDRIVYIGALCKRDFGDKDIITGCCYLELLFDGLSLVRVDYEFIPIPDIDLIQISFKEGDKLVKDDSNIVSFGSESIIKIRCEGTHEWFSSCSDYIKFLNDLFMQGGAQKVIIDFRPISNIDDDIIVNRDSIDFEQIIKEKAEKDGRNPDIGLDYFRRALSGS